MIDRIQNCLCQPLQDGGVIFGKGICLRRKNFEEADHLLAEAHWCGQDATDAEIAAVLTIHAKVSLGIVAAQEFSGADAFSGETFSHLELRAYGRSVRA